MPACKLLGPEVSTALPLACAVVVLLLLAVIALGFGPLRAWLGLSVWRRASRAGSIDSDGSVLWTWRLYRQIGRVEAGRRCSPRAGDTIECRTSGSSTVLGGG